ncbi:MAG: iron-containing alcohol dehydrogenase [Actinobacteria bacterium]|nr:iron-containing alcohol dehydrogenase [Actinomycetota bacterium]
MSGAVGFSVPTRIVAGIGSLACAGELLGGLGAGRVAVVCDAGVAAAGLLVEVEEAVAGEPLFECSPVAADPSFEAAAALVAEAREAGCERVLGVGGGSGLGAAKAVALGLANPEPLEQLEGVGVASEPAVPCLAIPTTAGSGSEVSNAFVLKRAGGGPAQAIVRGPGYEPRVALLDGRLLRRLPERPMVYAGLDALSHALEALWARGRSRFTDALARAAAAQLLEALPRALDGRRDDDLQVLIEASAMANLACGSAGLGLAHALSAASAVRLPHGYQNGVLLPHVAAFNRDLLDPVDGELVDRLDGLYASIGFEPSFATGDLGPAEVEAMVAAAGEHPFRRNNARVADETDLRDLLRRAGAPDSRT